ncbi:MAG: hypothetical protein Q4D27_05445 [Coriobacteriia bacterium]|nr:hypothetical protein [Coriobacteriia bacterium]
MGLVENGPHENDKGVNMYSSKAEYHASFGNKPLQDGIWTLKVFIIVILERDFCRSGHASQQNPA